MSGEDVQAQAGVARGEGAAHGAKALRTEDASRPQAAAKWADANKKRSAEAAELARWARRLDADGLTVAQIMGVVHRSRRTVERWLEEAD